MWTGPSSGYAQFVAPDGNAIGGDRLGVAVSRSTPTGSCRLCGSSEGKAPTTPDQVVMDKATATKYHFKVGDRVRVLLSGPPQTFTISGIVTFGSDDNLAGTTLAGFDLPTAQDLFHSRGYYDTIDVLAKPGADNVQLAAGDRQGPPAGRAGGQRSNRRQRAVKRGQQRAVVPLDGCCSCSR